MHLVLPIYEVELMSSLYPRQHETTVLFTGLIAPLGVIAAQWRGMRAPRDITYEVAARQPYYSLR